MTIPATIAREPAKIVMDALVAELGLDAEHCLLGDQKWDIPQDKKLFVVIFDDTPKPFGAVSYLDTDPASPTVNSEVQQQADVHDVRVEIMSLDSGEARQRKEEVGMALGSFFSQQLQDKYLVQIGRAQAPVNASETEGTARLQKYVTHVNVTCLHQKIKPPTGGYYDKFNGATADGTANPPEVSTQ